MVLCTGCCPADGMKQRLTKDVIVPPDEADLALKYTRHGQLVGPQLVGGVELGGTLTADLPDIVQPATSVTVIATLAKLDEETGVVNALEHGYIRLVDSQWLLAQLADYRIENRQALERRETQGESPLLQPAKAVELVHRANRSVGVVSHGWLSPGEVRSVDANPPSASSHRLLPPLTIL